MMIAATQVSNVYGIASTGTSVFNAQIVAMGARTIIAIAISTSRKIFIISSLKF